MLQEQHYIFTNPRTECSIRLTNHGTHFDLKLQQKLETKYWEATFDEKFIEDLTAKSGKLQPFAFFRQYLEKALSRSDQTYCYLDVLTSQDLQDLKNKKSGVGKRQKSKGNKRYIIITIMTSEEKVHYPLPLAAKELSVNNDRLRDIYNQLRAELDKVKSAVLNETSRSDMNTSSFSINYEKRGQNNKTVMFNTTSNMATTSYKQIDQLKTEREILKNKLKRIQEQSELKKGAIEANTIINKAEELKKVLETPNMALIEVRSRHQEVAEKHAEIIKELLSLHAEITKLLTTDKEIKLKKHGEDINRQLQNVKVLVAKNAQEMEKLKKNLQAQKTKNKELEMKLKKLKGEQDARFRNKKNGPYSSYSISRKGSSTGSITSKRSFNSFFSR